MNEEILDCALSFDGINLGVDRLQPLAEMLRKGELPIFSISAIERDARSLLAACDTIRRIVAVEQGLA